MVKLWIRRVEKEEPRRNGKAYLSEGNAEIPLISPSSGGNGPKDFAKRATVEPFSPLVSSSKFGFAIATLPLFN